MLYADSLSRCIPVAIVEADNCSVFLVDKKRQQLWSVASESGREFRIPIDAGIAAAVAMSGDTINIAGADLLACSPTRRCLTAAWLADCYADARFNQANDKKTGFRTRNMLAMPLKDGEVRSPALAWV